MFISYAHDDQKLWLDSLLRHLAPQKGHGVEFWTDRDIVPEDLWHDDIQSSLELGQAFHEMTDGKPAPSTEAPPPKPVEVEKLERKIDLWLTRFLGKFNPNQRGQILQIICDMARARLERISA
jgi:hypothetical protein